ncbi:hypothetical protein OG889_43645 [Streptomyces sp. NBC_00481]|uniref:hypothetical protein n=1 Tax=unclassified Streptomyces TaxID=2593676 RepID=UPI002DDB207A|nr:hypothetical protein [Streptomyces sp. NBC_00481]WRZ00972.1 hypothetical protein OG889_43645 [Streptomyces sp. NBC_00481]
MKTLPVSTPSVSYSMAIRLEVPRQQRGLPLTTTMEALGGSVTAIAVISSDADRLGIDVTIAATSTAHDTGSAARGCFTRQRPPIHG